MSGGKHIKLAIIATLCEHPDAEKYKQRAFSSPEKMMEAMGKSQALTKADFLTPDDEGKYIIDSAGAWKNFDKIAKLVQDGGDKFTYEDFMKPLGSDPQKTLLESAKTHGGLGKIFTFGLWEGRFEEMERVWYKVPVPFRRDMGNGGLIAADLKRELFAAEGKETPEDRLAKADLTPADIRGAFTGKDNYEVVMAKLTAADDYLRKEYILLRDVSGDTLFDNRAEPWNKYGTIMKSLHEHGERLEVADYIKQVTYTKNILSRAAEHRALDKVFTPAHWADRLPEMLNLWSHVLEGWKTAPMTTADFDNSYAVAETLTYAKIFEKMSVTGKADLLKPLNKASEGEKPVLPLGLKAVWDNLDAVQAQLGKSGEQLTLADLRTPTGQMGNSCLMSAVKFGHFDKVVDIAKQSGEPVTVEDFLNKDRQGNTLISILAEKRQLSAVFAPEIWVGRVQEMKSLWYEVSPLQRQQVDFEQIETAVKQATLKQHKGGFKLQPKPGKKTL